MNRGTRSVTVRLGQPAPSGRGGSTPAADAAVRRGTDLAVDLGPRIVDDDRPSPEQMRAWRAFLVAHASLVRRLEDDLLAEQGLPLAMYDVLVQLAETEGRRLRMTELAGAVLLSRSGLTRLVDRMTRAGYVRREPSPSDARGIYAVLTDAGYERLRQAAPTHLRGVQSYVLQRLDDDELAMLGAACARLADWPGEPAVEGPGAGSTSGATSGAPSGPASGATSGPASG